ncbi:sensor histidine kinase [Nonomuraea phyllanthi]|uniref:Sensor histidine kinase n=1 Tax=Nonomuraea phyllanthi TaxID=2219224 RepID=A0A5C4WF25_9ACTN|nr:sensor histidine kinase [Nonomuraea phyllanthi]KAB8193551.1 sensor histidine kinase [Nonomuraea phyllanthi]QFY12292.1 sensor histidine kinase [Nonomuraea phyllanthi]
MSRTGREGPGPVAGAAGPGSSRWDRVAPVLPYLFIVLPAGASLLQGWRADTFALSLFAVAWHWFMVSAHPEWTRRPVVALAYFVVLLAALGALVSIDSLFTVAGPAAFIQAFALLPRWWAYAGVAATAGVLVSMRPDPGRSAGQMLFSFLVAALIASAIGLVVQTISDQNEGRKVMIAQLQESGAKLAALAEENANLQAQLLSRAREAGVLGERQRMAREIHDTIAQGLAAIVTQVEAADEALDDVTAARARLDTVRTLARDSLKEARRSVRALRPAPLAESQLPAALQEVAAKWSEAAGVPCSVEVTGEAGPLHAEVEITLLRVAQEALANVAKHAGAGRVALTLSYMEDVVVLDVRDDGAGFVPAPPGLAPAPGSEAGGFGLLSMRQRVTRLAGDFQIESAPGEGAGISATVPAIPADTLDAVDTVNTVAEPSGDRPGSAE